MAEPPPALDQRLPPLLPAPSPLPQRVPPLLQASPSTLPQLPSPEPTLPHFQSPEPLLLQAPPPLLQPSLPLHQAPSSEPPLSQPPSLGSLAALASPRGHGARNPRIGDSGQVEIGAGDSGFQAQDSKPQEEDGMAEECARMIESYTYTVDVKICSSETEINGDASFSWQIVYGSSSNPLPKLFVQHQIKQLKAHQELKLH